jgi:hypothetical protein
MLILQSDRVFDLMVFELDRGVVGVAIGMVFGQDSKSLLMALSSHQPSGGLWNPPKEGDLNDRGCGLDERNGAPRPVIVDVDRAKADECAD